MPTQADLDAASAYSSIMEEAKLRALSINTITSSSVRLPLSLLREYGFLQLRMLCELIALGCLVARSRDLLDPKNQPPTDFQDIQDWGQKILNLLSVHLISRVGGNFHFFVALEAPQAGGNVLVSVAESPKS